MRTAVCPGSFDPITKGHIDIITRAAKLFDQVIVLISVNYDKTCSFSVEERCKMAKLSVAHLSNVAVDSFDGLLANYVREKNACAIVKGLRAVSDFEYEFQMALANKKLYGGAETIFLTTSGENMYLSSSLVRQIASFGGDITHFVPHEIIEMIQNRFESKNKLSKSGRCSK